MKIKSLVAIFAISLGSISVVAPSAQAVSYSIGDTGPGGGKIFLTPSTAGNSTGLYFEVAPVDVSGSRMLWCNSSNQTIPGANGTAIGSGKTNTQAMLNHGCTSGAGYAASQYTNNGYSDWYLPSSGEVVEAQKRYGHGIFTGAGLDNADIHWTSTWVSSSTSYIWYPYISGASLTTSYSLAGGGFFVRAIRSFEPFTTQAEIDADNKAKQDELERKRREAVEAARREIVRKVIAHIDVLKEDLRAAEALIEGSSFIAAANADFSKLETSTASYPKIGRVIKKYQLFDQISGNSPALVSARELVEYGVILRDTPMKTLTTWQLMKLPIEDRDTVEEINAYFAKSAAAYVARQERLASIIAKIHSR